MAGQETSNRSPLNTRFSGRLWKSPKLPYIKAGLIVWGAEAAIGMLPLLAHWLVSAHLSVEKLAPGAHVESSVLPEKCILAVVISGLALLTVFELDTGTRPLKHEFTTCFMLVAAIVSLVSGAIFYGLVNAGIATEAESVVTPALVTALVSSFSIAIRKAIGDSNAAEGPVRALPSINKRDRGAPELDS